MENLVSAMLGLTERNKSARRQSEVECVENVACSRVHGHVLLQGSVLRRAFPAPCLSRGETRTRGGSTWSRVSCGAPSVPAEGARTGSVNFRPQVFGDQVFAAGSWKTAIRPALTENLRQSCMVGCAIRRPPDSGRSPGPHRRGRQAGSRTITRPGGRVGQRPPGRAPFGRPAAHAPRRRCGRWSVRACSVR